MNSINILSKWHKIWAWNDMKTSNGKHVKHVELIVECLKLMKNKDVNFLKVKSHVNIWYNEVADRLANEGAEIDKYLYNV